MKEQQTLIGRARASLSVVAFSILVAVAGFSSCGGNSASVCETAGDTLHLKYSELLTIVRNKNCTIVDVANPWKKVSRLHRYVLISKNNDSSNMESSYQDATIIRTPIQKTIPFSEVHAALIDELGKKCAISGIADLMYYTDSVLLPDVKSGRITDIGLSANPDIERIIDLSPDAILVSPFENSGGYGKLEQMGIPLIECADYMETSPLARAEWIKFYGMLYGAESTADSIFAAVDSSYNSLKTTAAKATYRPTVMIDKMTGSTWYMPGGRSTIGQMLTDAGMTYLYDDTQSAGSLPLAFEAVLDRCEESDIWIFRHSYSMEPTYETLLSEHNGYSRFRPFQRKKCFNCNVSTSRFFIETPFHPEKLLRDFIIIAHPELQKETETKFFFAL